MTDIREKEAQIQQSLRKAITDALENKRRLGQYAVVSEGGKPKRIEPGHTTESASPEA